jgi:hypothetical protein
MHPSSASSQSQLATPHSLSGVFQTRMLIFPDVQASAQHL